MVKLKLNEDSELFLCRGVITKVDKFNREIKIMKWEKAKEDINFGSIKNPKNVEILAFKYVIPEKRKDEGNNPFKNIFG